MLFGLLKSIVIKEKLNYVSKNDFISIANFFKVHFENIDGVEAFVVNSYTESNSINICNFKYNGNLSLFNNKGEVSFQISTDGNRYYIKTNNIEKLHCNSKIDVCTIIIDLIMENYMTNIVDNKSFKKAFN